MDDNLLSLGMSEEEVSTCTWKRTNPSSSSVTADIKHEPLADIPDEQLLSNSTDPLGVTLNEQFSSSGVNLEASGSKRSQIQSTNLIEYGKTLLPSSNIFDYRSQTSLVRDPKMSQNCYSYLSNTETSALYSRKVLHYRRKENLSSSTVNHCQSESELIDERGTSQTRVCLPEELNITMYTKNSDAECTKKHQFMNVHGAVYILDHIDSTEKKKNTSIVHTNKNPALNMNNKAKACDKIKTFPDGELYFTENTVMNIEESTVANCKLPSEIQLLHDTNRTLNEEISKCDKAENQMDDINQSLNLSSVQNQIKIENIDQISDISNGEKEIESDDINLASYLTLGSNMKMESKHQPSDLLQGHKQTEIQVLTNGNFTDCKYIENQTLVIRTKKENIQDETPTLNHYHENMCEFEQTICTQNLHLDHSNAVHKDGINKPCCKVYKILTAFVHDHKYYNVPQGDWKTDTRVKENKHLLHLNNMLNAHRNKLKEHKNLLKEQRKEKKLKAMEVKRKLKTEACRSKLNKQNIISKEQRKKEKLKAMEEKRKLKLQPVPCSICEKMILPKNRRNHKMVCSEEPFLCTFCGKLLQNKRDLYLHEMNNHDERPKNCDICHKTFKSRIVLVAHRRRIHMKDKSKRNFLCSICGKTFADGVDLKDHTWIHSDEKPFKCSYCDADFKKKRYLLRHIRTCHVSEKIFSCTESGCERKFNSKGNLQTRVMLHQDCKTDKDEGPLQIGFCHNSGKIFSCTESGCERKYKSKEALRRHVKWHQQCKTGENPFKCGYCYAEFKIKGYLQRHINFCHDPEKMYSCTESGCGRKYNSKDSLQRHVKWHQKCKAAAGPINPTRTPWSSKENSILRAVFKEEISSNKRIDIEKMRVFIEKYPWVLKDVQTQNDLRLQKIRTKLYMERFINKHPSYYHGKTNTPSEPSDSNSGETEPSDSNSGETEAHLHSEPSDSNSGENEAHLLSEPSDSNSG